MLLGRFQMVATYAAAKVTRVQVRHFEPGDLLDLRFADLGDLIAVAVSLRSFRYLGGLFQKNRSRRGLGNERKRPV